MTSTRFALGVLLLLISIAGSSQQADVRGRWSGAFHSRHANVRPFTITGPIDLDPRARLIYKAQVTTDCFKNFKDVDLEVTVNGPNFSAAGSNEDGTVTLLGTIDGTGRLLNLQYIINGSYSGGCQVDTGTGDLQKQ